MRHDVGRYWWRDGGKKYRTREKKGGWTFCERDKSRRLVLTGGWVYAM